MIVLRKETVNPGKYMPDQSSAEKGIKLPDYERVSVADVEPDYLDNTRQGRKPGMVRTAWPRWTRFLNPRNIFFAALGLLTLGQVVSNQNSNSEQNTSPVPQTDTNPTKPATTEFTLSDPRSNILPNKLPPPEVRNNFMKKAEKILKPQTPVPTLERPKR